MTCNLELSMGLRHPIVMDIKCQKMSDVSVRQSFAKEPYKRDHILQKRSIEMDIKCQKMTDVSVKQSFAKEPYKRDHILQKRPLETQSSPPYKDGYQMSEDDCGDGR